MKGFYKEEQKFTQWWLWGLIGISTASVFYILLQGMYVQFILGEPWGDRPMSDTGLALVNVFTFITMGGILFLFISMKLTIEVHNRTIYYRFAPFIIQNRRIGLEEIESWEVKKFSLFKDFGGYGMRKGFSGKTAYNIRGNAGRGLRMKLKNGKDLLLGTQRPDELRAAIQHEFDRMDDPYFD